MRLDSCAGKGVYLQGYILGNIQIKPSKTSGKRIIQKQAEDQAIPKNKQIRKQVRIVNQNAEQEQQIVWSVHETHEKTL